MLHMSTDTTQLTFTTESADATEKLAQRLGQRLKGGEVIELTSDLGGGKTTFTRGLVLGSGSSSHVSSPTFKISNTYKAPKFDIIHYDFYRLPDAGLMRHELADILGDSHVVIVVEWADAVRHVLPEQRLIIQIASSGESTRTITFSYPASLGYLYIGD